MSEEIPVTHTFKVLVLGDSGVGKTSLIKYYTEGEASPNILSTIGRQITVHTVAAFTFSSTGIDYSDVNITVRGITVKLRVW